MESCFWTSQVATCQSNKQEMKFLYQQIPTRCRFCMPKGTRIANRPTRTQLLRVKKAGKWIVIEPAAALDANLSSDTHFSNDSATRHYLTYSFAVQANLRCYYGFYVCSLSLLRFQLALSRTDGWEVHCGARHVERLGNWKISIAFHCLLSIKRKWWIMIQFLGDFKAVFRIIGTYCTAL